MRRVTRRTGLRVLVAGASILLGCSSASMSNATGGASGARSGAGNAARGGAGGQVTSARRTFQRSTGTSSSPTPCRSTHRGGKTRATRPLFGQDHGFGPGRCRKELLDDDNREGGPRG